MTASLNKIYGLVSHFVIITSLDHSSRRLFLTTLLLSIALLVKIVKFIKELGVVHLANILVVMTLLSIFVITTKMDCF